MASGGETAWVGSSFVPYPRDGPVTSECLTLVAGGPCPSPWPHRASPARPSTDTAVDRAMAPRTLPQGEQQPPSFLLFQEVLPAFSGQCEKLATGWSPLYRPTLLPVRSLECWASLLLPCSSTPPSRGDRTIGTLAVCGEGSEASVGRCVGRPWGHQTAQPPP